MNRIIIFLIKIPAVLLLYFSIDFCLAAQNIESLERTLKDESITETGRLEVLNQLSLVLSLVDADRSLAAANEAVGLASRLNDDNGLANAYRNISIIYFYYNENYSESMEYLQRALNIFESLDDSVGIANCYISLGHAYRSLYDRPKEIEYHRKSFEIFTRMNNIERIGVTALNVGESYLNNGELEKSRPLLEYAIRVNDSINKLTSLSTCYKAKGMLEFKQNNLRQAEDDFKMVLRISDKLGINSQKITTIESMIQLAFLNKLKGDQISRLDYLRRAAEFSHKNELINYLRIIYIELIQYYSETDNKTEVQRYIEDFKEVSDSINSRQLKDRSNQISSILQVNELEKDKRKLEQHNLLQKERLRMSGIIILIVFVSLSVLIWLVLKISRNNKKITEVNLILNSQREIIESQRQHLEELNNTKDKFFSIVAHDLRSPLVSLKMFSDLLIDQVDTLSMEEISTMGNELQSTVDNSIKMTDNLLTWARLQMKDYEVRSEAINLSELISDIYGFYREVAERKGIEFDCSVDDTLTISGDKDQVAFIIRNLVNNAIKFTDKGGYVRLTAESSPDGEIQISVTDNGTGISDDIRKNIFSIGRKKSVIGTAGEKGTGLGLILSYEFVKLNNGVIEVRSQPGKGTTFKLRLKKS